MKYLSKMLFAVLGAFVSGAQACWAEFGEQRTLTMRAQADLSALQYRVMRGTGSGIYTNMCSETAVTSLGGRQAIGVLQNEPKIEEAATVAWLGLSKVVVGAATTAHMLATHNASGQAIDAVSGSVVIGRFMEATGGAGEVATILLFPPTRWGAIL